MKIERCAWSLDKLVKATLSLYKEGRIRGIFLSSSLFSDPDVVVEKEILVAKVLREKGFMGYIHLRLMPGVNKSLIKEAVKYADRIGINVEAPVKDAFDEIAPDKGSYELDIWKRLEFATWIVKKFNRKVTVDTQLIYWRNLGSDMDYLKVTEKLYEMGLERVYFSPFKPVKGTPLEKEEGEEFKRVLSIYKASFLLRDYGIKMSELKCILDENGNLPHGDPKVLLARKLDIFPLDIKEATYRDLLLVPGIGPKTAKKIIKLKKEGRLTLRNLKRITSGRFQKIRNYLKI
jgi:predicted DNA-binding helix-hairpin-helix protein